MQQHLTKANNNQALAVSSGDVLTIELDETPATGYSWEVDNIAAGIVQLQSSDYALSSGSAVGGGGKRRMVFVVEGNGKGSLQLKNWRPWSGDVAETFHINLEVG